MKNIYLIGMPGSGKSTLGIQIAEMLNREHIDTDEEITRNENETPEQIIMHHGEMKLRTLENELLKKLILIDGLVVSTGGGLPVFHDNMQLMNDHGITVYIHYDADMLWERLEQDRARPLSPTLKSVRSLLSAREKIYRKAQIVISGERDMKLNLATIMDSLV